MFLLCVRQVEIISVQHTLLQLISLTVNQSEILNQTNVHLEFKKSHYGEIKSVKASSWQNHELHS